MKDTTATTESVVIECDLPDPPQKVWRALTEQDLLGAWLMPKTKRRLNEIYARHCGRTYEEVERTLDRDHFMTAAEAKEWGLVDHVYTSREAAQHLHT